jgi:hypothetical protein
MLEENKKELISQLEQSTGCTSLFLDKFGENLCWGFNTQEGSSGVAITNENIQGQIIVSLKNLEAMLAKIKEVN